MKTLFKLQLYFFLILLSFRASSQAGEWTWISGSNMNGAAGVYGIQGVPSVSNHPPGLYEYAEWKDLQGNFWLYGGWDPTYSDLWKFDPVTLEWTWVKGNAMTSQLPVYGTLGVSSPVNTPGGRSNAAITWTDLTGNLWLFGGNVTNNDLWKYTISTNEWTWMSGTTFLNDPGVYGIKGVPSPLNVPPSRCETASSWTDSLNNLWMFGGASTGNTLNDLWRYSIATNEWTWMSGSSTPGAANIYGTKGVANATNCPSARISYSKWMDKYGNFWLMGGSEVNGYKEDVWKFDPLSNQWTWMAGTSNNSDVGVYQATCLLQDSVNRPHSRIEHRSTVTDQCGRFWLFGGRNYSGDFMNDLWVFDPDYATWTWISGTNTNQTNIYGTLGVPAATNRPGSRWGSVSWWGNDNRFYLLGGNNNNIGPSYADLWVYTPDCISVCNAPVAAIAGPTHICPGSCINFTSLSQNVTSWLWIFTGASVTTSTDENPQNVCYNTPGTYDVTLIVSNANGSDTMALLNHITVYPYPAPQGILQGGDTLYANQGAVTYQWYFNNVIINGATNYFYVATQSGDYNVVCTDSNNCEVEAVRNDVIAGFSPTISTGEGTMMRFYPNPATEELFIDAGNLKIEKIEIVTLAGKKVLSIEKDSRVIDIAGLSDGNYFIEVRSNNAVYRSRFVKNSKR